MQKEGSELYKTKKKFPRDYTGRIGLKFLLNKLKNYLRNLQFIVIALFVHNQPHNETNLQTFVVRLTLAVFMTFHVFPADAIGNLNSDSNEFVTTTFHEEVGNSVDYSAQHIILESDQFESEFVITNDDLLSNSDDFGSIVIAQTELPILSINNTTFNVNEDVSGSNFVVKYQLSSAASGNVSFNYSMTDITTTKSSDYTEVTNRTITISEGDTSENSFSIPIINDSNYEGNETFTLTLSNLTGANFNTGTIISQTITIIDDEGPTISFANTPIEVMENVTGGKLEVVVNLSGPSNENISVGYATAPPLFGNAEYRHSTGTLSFAPGVVEAKFEIEIINDLDIESTYSFNVGMFNITGSAKFANNSVINLQTTISIIDDDTPRIEISADSFTIAEDIGNFDLKLSISGVYEQPTIGLAIRDGTAIFQSDFNLRQSSVQFDATTSEISVSIPIVDNSTPEIDETFSIIFTQAQDQHIKFSNGEEELTKTITIVDDDSTILSITNTSLDVSESVTGGEFLVTVGLSSSTRVPVKFNFSLQDDSAKKGSDKDYTEPTNRLVTIPSGTTGSFSIPIVNDTVYEATERFQLTLSNLVGANFASGHAMRFINITDDDQANAPVLTITNPTFKFAENHGQINLSYEFSFTPTAPAIFAITMTSGTALADIDFVSFSGQVSEEGHRQSSLPISITNDEVEESNETFTIMFSNPVGVRFSGGATSLTSTITIVDDDSTTLSISNTEFSVDENVTSGNYELSFSLSNTTEVDVLIKLNSIDGTAITGQDYTLYNTQINSVTIPKGQTTGSYTIPITNDSIREGAESFTVTISQVIGARIASDDSSKLITIVDDETSFLTIEATTYKVGEDAGNFTFKVKALGEHGGFGYRLATGKNGDSAVVSQDFTQFSTHGGFSPVSREREFSIEILDDSDLEGDHTFTLTLTIPYGNDQIQLPKGVSEYSKTITIVDDESTTLSIANTTLSVDEDIGIGGFILKIGFPDAIDVDVSFDYTLMDGTAEKILDYSEPTNKTVTILAGDTVGTFSIPIVNDIRHEGNESFTITLNNPIGAVYASGETLSTTITIVDDEFPTISLISTPLSIAENVAEEEIMVAVSLSGASNRTIAIDYTTLDITAISGEDYSQKQGVLNFEPGSIEKQFAIGILDDMDNEGNESFNLQLSVSIGNAVFLGGESSFTKSVTIVDNELPTLSITNTKFSVGEDVKSGKFELEFKLSGATSRNVSMNYAITGGTAMAGVDYNSSSQRIEFTSGMVRKILPIMIIDNSELDRNKSIRFSLTNLNGVVLAGGQSRISRTITIVDDESTTFSLSTASFKVNENVTGGEFEVSAMLSTPIAFDVTYEVSTQDGTAINGQDYTRLANKIITFEAGSTTSTFAIPILNDVNSEGEESFTIKIENVIGAVIVGNTSIIENSVTIVDDEMPTLILGEFLSSSKLAEGGGPYSLSLTTSTRTAVNISVEFSTSDGTASSVHGRDYTPPRDQTFSLTSGTTIQIPNFVIADNAVNEGDRTFTIDLNILSGAVFLGNVTRKTITMTIVDDDSLILSITNQTHENSVNEDVGKFVLNYSLSSTTVENVSFNFSLQDGTAKKGFDYAEPANRTVTIPSGTLSGSISISILDDSFAEGTEFFTIILSSLRNATFPGRAQFSRTIVSIKSNDLPTLSISNDNFTVVENVMGGNFTLNIDLSRPSFGNVTFDVSFVDVTATKGVDYTGTKIPVTINHGQTTKRIQIPITDDSSNEGNETFKLQIKNLSNAVYPSDSVSINGTTTITKTITILDNESPVIQITTTNFKINEVIGDSVLEVNYILSKSTIRDVTFEYELVDITTIKGLDYTNPPNRLERIAQGSANGSFSITIKDDVINEGNETFTLMLSNITGASAFHGVGLEYSQIVTIVDNELPTLSVTNSDLNVEENVENQEIVVDVKLTGATHQDVRFDYTLEDGTAKEGSDFTQPVDRLKTIQMNETTETISIPIINDSNVEGNESFRIIFNIRSGAVFDDGSTTNTETVTIFDDELPTLTFHTTPIKVAENVNSGELAVNVSIPAIIHRDITFDFDMVDVTTTKEIDYFEAGVRKGTISAGSRTGSFTIPIVDDVSNEGNETFTLSLSQPINAVFSGNVDSINETVTIEDDEPPTLKFKTNNFNVEENVTGSAFLVEYQLTNPTGQNVTFEYGMTDITATKGVDYTEKALTERKITIISGDTSGSFSIPIENDNTNEGDESFILALSDIVGAVSIDGSNSISQTITIEDDELPTLSFATSTFKVFEDVGDYTVEIKLSGPTDEDVSFKYALTDDSASKGFDYTEAEEGERTLTISGGDITQIISIPIRDDSSDEEDETFTLTLSDLSGAIFAEGSNLPKTITIVDNDSIFLSFLTTNFTVAEDVGSNGFVVNVQLSEASDLEVTFDFALENSSATKGLDFIEVSDRTRSIEANQTTGSFSIPILDDLDIEGSEAFTLTLSNVLGATFVGNVNSISQSVSIIDNETPRIAITTTNFNVSEVVGSSEFELNFELITAWNHDVHFNYSTHNITATMGTDFETLSGTFTFVAGQTTGSISIPILDDLNIEMSETFRIELVAQGGAEFSNSLSSIRNISVTILDNESPTLSITGGSMVTESDVSGSPAYARFTISTPIEPTTNNFTVRYTPTSSNFVANSGSPTTSRALDFSDPDNDGIYTAELRVEIVSDKDKEVNGNLEVSLNADTVGTEKYFVNSSADSATVFVVDDDAVIPELSLESLSTPIGESAGEVVFTVLASEAPGRELTIYYTPAEVGSGDFLTKDVASETSSSVIFQTLGGKEKGSITVNLDNDIREPNQQE